MARQPVRLPPPAEPEPALPPLPPALFEALVDAWVELLRADLALDEAQAKLQDRVDGGGDATAS